MAKKRKDAAPPAVATAEPAPAELMPLHEREKFVTERINRSELKNAEYNPRVISDKARRKLKKIIGKLGLLGPLHWNRKTGRIVGGHQRIKIMDAYHGGPNYSLTVAVLDLDEKAEREANIALNNSEAMGEFDLDALAKMFKEDKIDPEAAGYDLADIYQMFGEDIMAGEGEKLEEMAKTLEQLRADSDRVHKSIGEAHDPHFYNVVVHPSREARFAMSDALGIEDNRYIDGVDLTAVIEERNTLRTEVNALRSQLGMEVIDYGKQPKPRNAQGTVPNAHDGDQGDPDPDALGDDTFQQAPAQEAEAEQGPAREAGEDAQRHDADAGAVHVQA